MYLIYNYIVYKVQAREEMSNKAMFFTILMIKKKKRDHFILLLMVSFIACTKT